MPETTCNGRIGLNPGAAGSIHDNGLVVLHVPSGQVFTSNRTGARIWQGLEQQLPLEAIAAEIGREYGMDGAIVLEHTKRFVADLERNGLTK